MKDEMESLLWRYVEGDCTTSEVLEVERECLMRPEMKDSLHRIRLIHKELSSPLLSQAPDYISSNVLNAIAIPPVQHNGISLKPLGVLFTILTIITCLSFYTISPQTQGVLGELSNLLPESMREISLSLPSITSLQSYIFMLLFLVPGLYFLDQFLQKKDTIHIRTFSY